MAFNGFGKPGIAFLKGLELDNSKPYFEAHRSDWETGVKEPLSQMLDRLSLSFGGRVKVFRQNRDVRFAKDKSPYKTNTFGVILERAKSAASLYASVSAKGLECGTGYYDMAKDQLTAYRAALDHAKSGKKLDTVLGALEEKGIALRFNIEGSLPRGFAKDHPRVALLRQTALVVGASLKANDKRLFTAEALDFVAQTWTDSQQLGAWLDANVGPSEIPPEVRFGGGRARPVQGG